MMQCCGIAMMVAGALAVLLGLVLLASLIVLVWVAIGRLRDRSEVVGHCFVTEESQRLIDVDGRSRQPCEHAVAAHLDHGERSICAELRFPRRARVLRGVERTRGGISPP